MHTMQNPLEQFASWLAEAKACAAIAEPTAMMLATATAAGIPSARTVLLKAQDARGFVFYTNMESKKSGDLIENPHAALSFYWMPLERQVHIRGNVERVSDTEADAYFASRERGKQIGAWASAQSRPMASPTEFEARIETLTNQYEGKPIPRPRHWSGWRVMPHTIEFWQQGQYRLHRRDLYTRSDTGWVHTLLYP